MKSDKILKQYFEEKKETAFSVDFNSSIMDKIDLAIEKKQRKQYWVSILLVGIISAGMIIGSVFLLKDNISSLWKRLPNIVPDFDQQNAYLVELYIFIAFIALFLLLIDFFYRQKKRKHS